MSLTELAAAYAAQVRAYNAQAEAMQPARNDPYSSGPIPMAQRLSDDPRREVAGLLSVLAEYVRPTDVLVDVGGGSGRYGLPLALRCQEVINVEPSPAMRAQFEASAAQAGITNARLIPSNWQAAEGVQGDVALVAHVTYFIEDIVLFIEKLNRSIRQRVIIDIHSTPPPNRNVELHQALRGEPKAFVPGHRELLAILWEMGLLPEIRVLPLGMTVLPILPTREAAIETPLRNLNPSDPDRARDLLERNFDAFYMPVTGGFMYRYGSDAHELLITWETTGGE